LKKKGDLAVLKIGVARRGNFYEPAQWHGNFWQNSIFLCMSHAQRHAIFHNQSEKGGQVSTACLATIV